MKVPYCKACIGERASRGSWAFVVVGGWIDAGTDVEGMHRPMMRNPDISPKKEISKNPTSYRQEHPNLYIRVKETR